MFWENPVLPLVRFWAVWCRPCKMMGPVIEGASELFEGQVSFYKVNVDEVSELASKYEIMSIPNMIMFKDGKPVGIPLQVTILLPN